jgi:hypothetical protein
MATERTTLSVTDLEVAQRVRGFRDREGHPDNASALDALLSEVAE